MKDLKATIRSVPDFPKPGVVFRDITTLLADPEATRQAADAIARRYEDAGVDVVVGIESRGFIFGALVAERLGAAFAPVRKPGKLPGPTIDEAYELEYGTDSVEIHTDAIEPGQNVLLVDDLLATGGTMAACCRLVERLGGNIVGCAFVIELSFLGGREKLDGQQVTALVDYETE
ncbi:MAG: adenine phosphoribosyltransferase [Planctomycetota bacterium]